MGDKKAKQAAMDRLKLKTMMEKTDPSKEAMGQVDESGATVVEFSNPRVTELTSQEAKDSERELQTRDLRMGTREYDDDLDDHATKNKRLKRKFKMIRAIIDEEDAE